MSAPDQIHDIEAMIADFEASGLRELHVRTDEIEIYLSADPKATGLGPQAPAAAGVQQGAAAAPPTTSAQEAPAAPTPAPTTAASAGKPAAVTSDLPEGAVIVTAPYLGTFYRSPKPGSPVYVDVGSTVTEETEMCLVEVMKLFTAVRAGVSGTVHSILASDGQMVEAEQPLFAVVPN